MTKLDYQSIMLRRDGSTLVNSYLDPGSYEVRGTVDQIVVSIYLLVCILSS